MWCLEVIKQMNNPSPKQPKVAPVGLDENIIFLPRDMYDDALVGLSNVDGITVAVYDKDKIVDILAKEWLKDPTYEGDEDTAYHEALEYYYFNIEGSLGKGYPIYVSRQDLDLFLEDIEDVDKGSGSPKEEG